MTFSEFGNAVEGYLETQEAPAEQTRVLAWYIMRGYISKSDADKYDSPERLWSLPGDEKKKKLKEAAMLKRLDELPMATFKVKKGSGREDKRSECINRL